MNMCICAQEAVPGASCDLLLLTQTKAAIELCLRLGMLSRDQLLVAREDILLFLEANEPAPMQVRILTLYRIDYFFEFVLSECSSLPSAPLHRCAAVGFRECVVRLPPFILDAPGEA
jgi:hypothetical protein